MGLFGLMTGWDQDQAASNAVMANHLLESLSNQQKRQIVDLIVSKMIACRAFSNKSDALKHLNRSCRVTQMNFVSNACIELNILPKVSDGVGWRLIRNPFSVGGHTKPRDINAVIQYLKKRNPSAYLLWPGDEEMLDFVAWA